MAGDITLFLCGDVMTGRGIDQILPHPSRPILYEPYVRDARQYVELAEEVSGPVPRPADFAYPWGEALAELDHISPDLRIINLESAVTACEEPWPAKGINYRMHPANIPCLAAAKIDGCALANNHVLDWGYAGLLETLEVLQRTGIKTAGAGRNRQEAAAPAVFEIRGKGRVLLFSIGFDTSGIPWSWAVTEDKPGVNLLPDLSDDVAEMVGRWVAAVKQRNDVVVVSIHWGGNWGYRIYREEQRFTHSLIDLGVDLIHGHSSHHVKGIEVYNGKLILYGCGDFLNDYEGITGYEEFRDDLGFMYLPTLEVQTGRLVELRLKPTHIRRFRVNRASAADAQWLKEVIGREGKAFGTRAEFDEEGDLILCRQ